MCHLQKLNETVHKRQADRPQQELEVGLHELSQALHEAAITAVDLVVRGHHVGDEDVVSSAHLRRQEAPGSSARLRRQEAPGSREHHTDERMNARPCFSDSSYYFQ